MGVKLTFALLQDNAVAPPPNFAFALALLGGGDVDVKFIESIFENNDYNIPGLVSALYSWHASNVLLIYWLTIPFRHCAQNDGEGGYGALVEIEGGLVEFQSNCFFNNRALGNGLVISYGEELPVAVDNFGSGNDVEYRTDLECEFIALINITDTSFPNIACADFDASVCAVTDGTPSPDASPVVQPIASPVVQPFASPVLQPSPAPVVEPTIDTPTMTVSEDMPAIASADMPTKVVTGPDASPVAPPVSVPSSPVATDAPDQGPSLPPATGPSSPSVNSPSTGFTPNMKPSDITPSMFTPSMFSPFFVPPAYRTPAFEPTYDAPTYERPVDDKVPSIQSPSIDSPEYKYDETSVSLFCGGITFDAIIMRCHDDNCPSCDFAPLPASTEECRHLEDWFCDELVCCSDCDTLYEDAFECAQELTGLSGCSSDCRGGGDDNDGDDGDANDADTTDSIGTFSRWLTSFLVLSNVSSHRHSYYSHLIQYTVVEIDPFIVRFIGDFDLSQEDVPMSIMSAIDSLIPPFLASEMGSVLNDIGIDMEFIDISRYMYRRVLQSSTAAIQVSGDLELLRSDEASSWTSEKVTDIVKKFFTGASLVKLLDTLKANGLSMDEVTMQDGTTDSIVTNEGDSTQDGTGTSGNNNGDDGQQDSGESNYSMAMIVVAICAGFVCVIVAAALFTIGRRRRKRRRVGREMDSFTESDFTNLRSGQDELPDCNASVAGGSQVSFPDVFTSNRARRSGLMKDDEQYENEPIVKWDSTPATPTYQHSGDEYDGMLDDILSGDDDEDWDNDSSRAVNYKPRRKKSHDGAGDRKAHRSHHRRHHGEGDKTRHSRRHREGDERRHVSRHRHYSHGQHHQQQDDSSLTRAAEWARQVRKQRRSGSLSAPQPYDGESFEDEEEIRFYR